MPEPDQSSPRDDSETRAAPISTASDTSHERGSWIRPRVVVPVLIALAGILVIAGYLFQPWKLFVDEVVEEAAPVATAPATPAGPDTSGPAASGESSQPDGPTVLAKGRFISHEHETEGTVRILELADGRKVLRIENLATSNGPDLKVWLSKAPVIAGDAGWRVFGEYESVDLGPLKGNVGNQNYAIPAKVDVDDFTSVTIWCDRFSVSFGAAELSRAG